MCKPGSVGDLGGQPPRSTRPAKPGGSEHRSDHPHARGENNHPGRKRRFHGGPSPRTWGELSSPTPHGRNFRTIPTHVGRTTPEYALAPRLADHPHARGENGSCSDPSATIRGPSPRTWGEHLDHCAKAQSRRTIPTHVGRTASMVASPCCRSDHPHARGEN